MQQASQSAQAANVLFNVSEFDNVNDATTALVAMSAAYEDAANGIEKINIVDRLNLIGNNYAIATDELATALQDSASALTTSGNDLNEAIALVTSGNRVVQNASITGKGIRTIALRLTGTKSAAEELEEMGEDTSDMIMSQSKMRELIMDATKVASNNFQGFDIQDELGRYKSTYQIMLGLAQIWEEIRQADLKTGDNRQNLLLESIAGKNRANVAASILSSPDVLQSVYEDSSTKSAGSAMEENQKYLDSISGHLAKIQNAWQEMWANAANRDVVNMFIDLGTTILNVINKIGGLQSAFALLYGGTIIKGLMSADSLLVKFISRLDEAKASSKTLSDVFNTVFGNNKSNDENKSIFKGWAQIQDQREKRAKAKDNPEIEALDKQKKAQEEMNDILEEANELKEESTKISEEKTAVETAEAVVENTNTRANIKGAVSETADATATEKNTEETVKNTAATVADTEAENAQTISKTAGAAAQGMDGGATGLAAFASSPMTWLIAIPAIISAINIGLTMWKKHQQDLVDGAHEATNAWNENKTSLDNYTQQYQDLSTQLNNVNLSEEEQADIKKQIYDLQKQITDEYGHQADGVNLVNGNLDEQLTKLRQIKAEEAKTNLAHSGKNYKNAEEKLTKNTSYDMALNGMLSSESFQQYFNGLKGNWEQKVDEATGNYYVRFVGNALEAENAMDELFARLTAKKDEMGDEWAGSISESLMNSLVGAINKNDAILTKYKDDYNSYLEQSIFADTGTYGTENLSAGEVLTELEEAVNNYNMALQSGDLSQIDEAKTRFEDLSGLVDNIAISMGDDKFKRPFDDIIDKVNQTAESIYNINKKMQDSKVKSAAESVFGDLADNKKASKQIQDEVLNAAGVVLNMQRELAKEGLTGVLSPLYEDIDTKHTTRFGNVDLMNRTVPGQQGLEDREGYGKFGKAQVEIAFTPMFEADGKVQILDEKSVSAYISDIVNQATDESGNVDMNKIFTLDADPKTGKNLIAAVGSTAKKYSKAMSYLGKNGNYTIAMERLKKAAEQANIPVEKIITSMRNLGNRSSIRDMFKDTLPSVEEVKMALADTTGQFQDLQDFAEQNFNITAETPNAEIEGFIEAMQIAGLVATATTEESQKSLDDFYADVSNKINKISELASISSKGLSQGGLSFTKMLDEDKKVIESDVSKIVDSFQHIYDLDVGSLFEETATGIKLNMDAYRQLVQQEESATKLQFANKRKELESNLTLAQMQGASTSEINKIKQQIIDLDMLASAYDGATSATAKYLAQQNAADYGDNYEMFRDTTVKRADELMSKGMIGTEEFRTIAQLFSYDSLATASADKVLEAYQTGYNNVKKYLTEDATVGMQSFLDDLVELPEEYGKFIKNADGGYMLEFTDAQEDMLAEHLGVSKDMLESFYDMLNALGFDIHFFRDGTLNEFDKLNENIHDSQDRLKELKKTANDKDLIPDDLLEVDPNQLNTVEELQNYLNELNKLEIDPEVNSEEYEAWKTLLEQIQQKIDTLNSTTQNEDGSVSLGDFKQADEQVKYFKENFEDTITSLKEKNTEPITIKTAIENDEEIRKFGEMLASWPPEMQTYIATSLGINGFEPTNDPEQITQQLFGHLEKGIEIPAEVDFYKAGHKPIGADSISPENLQMGVDIIPPTEEEIKESVPDSMDIPATPDVQPPTEEEITEAVPNGIELPTIPVIDDSSITQNGANSVSLEVGVDPASAEAAKEEAANIVGSAEADLNVHAKLASSAKELEPIAQLGFNGEADFHLNIGADTSDAEKVIEKTKEEAEEEVETPMVMVPKNSAQDAANQAGAQQGVQTTTTETKVTNEEIHTTATADTSQVDTAAQSVSGLQAMNGTTVSVGLSVIGIENIETAKTNVDELIQKNKSKVTVTLIGNTALFNKAYLQANSALNSLAQKKTEPKISADNSNLKNKVSDSKDKLNTIKNKEINIKATQSGFSTITNWKHSIYDNLKNKEITVTTHYKTTGSKPNGGFQGSAHNQGTIVSNGHAYAGGTLSGNWGLPKAEKGALINELGSEIVVTPDGHWQILNSGDPTFVNLPKGAIIFNHKQTESLLKKGYVNGSHGRIVGGAFANGTIDNEDFDEEELEGSAYAIGTTGWNGQLSGMSHAASGGGSLGGAKKAKSSSSSKSSSGSKKSSGSKGSGSGKSGNSSNKSAKDFLQTLDGIETRLNRIDALITSLDTTASKTFNTFGTRSEALKQDLATVNKEINAINASLKRSDAAGNYLKKASEAAKQAGIKKGDEGYNSTNAVGTALSQEWINRIQNSVNSGKYFNIKDVTDEGLWKKIQAYQTWYEKYLNLQKKKQDQVNKLSELTIQQLQLIQTQWDAILNSISTKITANQNQIDLAIEKGYYAAEKYYTNQIAQNKTRKADLTKEANELQKTLDAAIKNGRIKKGSEEWYKWQTQIDNTKNEIINVEKEIVRLNNEIRQIRWDKFDRGQESLSNLASEMEFLNGLIYENDLFEENGAITTKGLTSLGLIAMQYDEYVKQAQQYRKEIKKLNKDLAKDPNNKTIQDQLIKWNEEMQSAIENAHSQKEAIVDLIEKGIQKQIEAMGKLIDEYEKALDAERDQIQYAESIAEKQKKINSIQKQLKAMEGDDSEEGASQRQKLRDQLKEAQKDLEEAQEDQRISDIKEALSEMQEKYEEVLNARLDNIEALFSEQISVVNANGSSIVDAIKDLSKSVGYDLTNILNKIVTDNSVKDNVSNNSKNALVSDTSKTSGAITNTNAAAIKDSPTPTVPTPASTTTKNTSSTTTKTTTTTKNGLVKENGKTYYYSNNKKKTGWVSTSEGKRYFSTKDGSMLTGIRTIGNTTYSLDKTTGLLKGTYTGLYKSGTTTRYYKNGVLQTGWKDMKEGKRYFSTKNGAMLTGLQTIGNSQYYFDANGIMKTGTFNVDDYTYTTDKDGKITKKVKRTGALKLDTIAASKNKTIKSSSSSVGSMKVKGALASGTPSVGKSGLYRVDEQGNEIFINKNGKIYTRLDKGTTVLPHKAALNLLEGMKNPVDFIMNNMDLRPNNISNNNTSTNNATNYITFNMHDVTNYAEFMREAQRDPNFTKYIQEISIGKLNGNNSLRGNAIQFR